MNGKQAKHLRKIARMMANPSVATAPAKVRQVQRQVMTTAGLKQVVTEVVQHHPKGFRGTVQAMKRIVKARKADGKGMP